MLFEVGETVVYPHHAPPTITEVKTRVIRGEEKVYLKLNVTQGDLTIEVPADNVDLVGVRDVIGKEGPRQGLRGAAAPFTEEPTNWTVATRPTSRSSPPATSSRSRRSCATSGVATRTAAFPRERSGCSPRRARSSSPNSRSPRRPTRSARRASSTRSSRPDPTLPPAARVDRTRRHRRRGREWHAARRRGSEGVRRGPWHRHPRARVDRRLRDARARPGRRRRPESRLAAARTIVARVAGPALSYATVVAGGDSRQESVAAGLAALGPDVSTVLIHDAARALTPPDLFARVARATRSSGAGVIPGLPVTDTVKRIDADGTVLETVDRSSLSGVQTPQGFPRAPSLRRTPTPPTSTHRRRRPLRGGRGIGLGRRRRRAPFKITTPWICGARKPCSARPPRPCALGIGTDVHAYDDSAPLWLGGLYWSGEAGLSGHSDGDAVLHAVCDALLSAAGSRRPRLALRHGRPAVRRRVERGVRARDGRARGGAGFRVVNVAVQVIAARPRIAPRRSEIEARVTALVGAPVTLARRRPTGSDSRAARRASPPSRPRSSRSPTNRGVRAGSELARHEDRERVVVVVGERAAVAKPFARVQPPRGIEVGRRPGLEPQARHPAHASDVRMCAGWRGPPRFRAPRRPRASTSAHRDRRRDP